MVKIVQQDDPVLRETSEEVPSHMIGSAEIKKVIADMKTALESQDDGVAIAAPQIGKLWRIFVLSPKVYELERDMKGAARKKEEKVDLSKVQTVFINPSIIKVSRDKEWLEEGCLSVRYLYGQIQRSKKVTIRFQDETGAWQERGGSSIIAQVFQHETDHLNGILFTDNAKDIHDMPPEMVAAEEEITP
jgi:peptide deformylase